IEHNVVPAIAIRIQNRAVLGERTRATHTGKTLLSEKFHQGSRSPQVTSLVLESALPATRSPPQFREALPREPRALGTELREHWEHERDRSKTGPHRSAILRHGGPNSGFALGPGYEHTSGSCRARNGHD